MGERSPMRWRRLTVRRAVAPLVSAAAILYFLVDAVLLTVIRPFLAWLGRRPVLARLERWVGSLGPYASLALLLIPLAVLEPLKPLGLYLMASGHPADGALVIGIGELLKLVTVERLYRASRDKLLTIPWFAWGHRLVTGWLARLRALPAWRAVVHAGRRIRDAARRLLRHVRFTRVRASGRRSSRRPGG